MGVGQYDPCQPTYPKKFDDLTAQIVRFPFNTQQMPKTRCYQYKRFDWGAKQLQHPGDVVSLGDYRIVEFLKQFMCRADIVTALETAKAALLARKLKN